MDYVDFHVRRIADNLRGAGISIPGNIPTTTTVDELRQETDFTIAQVHKSTIYLPRWIRDHRDDPALIVSLLVATYSESSHTLPQLGFYGSLTCPPP